MGVLDEALLGHSIGAAGLGDNIVITDCVVNPTDVDDITAEVTYAGCMRNDNDVTVNAQLAFYLQAGAPRPVMAVTDVVTIDPGEIWCPPEVTRRLDNPVADMDDIIGNVVALGGNFEITANPVNVVSAGATAPEPVEQIAPAVNTTTCDTLTVAGVETTACGMAPKDVPADGEVTLSADIDNPHGKAVEVDVEWRVKNTGEVLKRLPNRSIPGGASGHTVSGTVRPQNTIGQGTFDITAVIAEPEVAVAAPPGIELAREVTPSAVAGVGLGLGIAGLRAARN